MYRRETLSNGIRILTSPLPHIRSVCITCIITVGSRYEDANLSGVSHLIEHMVFKGSRNYPTARHISETIEGLGGVLDAGTDKELTVYTARIADEHFERACTLMADMLCYPLLDAHELSRERKVIIEELGMYRDSPQDWASVLADAAFWPDTPLGREVAGTRETVEHISRKSMVGYYGAHYVPGNLVFSVAGNIVHEHVVDVIGNLFGHCEGRVRPTFVPCTVSQTTEAVTVEHRSTEQTNLVLMTAGIPHDDPDYYELALLNTMLGEGMSSRLFQRVREEQGLAYDISSSPIHFQDTGAFAVYAGVKPRKAPAAIRSILEELCRLREEKVAEEELTRAKAFTRGRMALQLESAHRVASWIGVQEALLSRVRELDETLVEIANVTAEGVQRVANRLFSGKSLHLTLIGPHKSAEPFTNILHM